MTPPPVFVLKTGGVGPSSATRTRGFHIPNVAPYQLGYTRIIEYEIVAVVVKYVVREILPHFYKTFNSENCGDYQINGEVCNILCHRTDLVFQHPNPVPYQLGHTWG